MVTGCVPGGVGFDPSMVGAFSLGCLTFGGGIPDYKGNIFWGGGENAKNLAQASNN